MEKLDKQHQVVLVLRTLSRLLRLKKENIYKAKALKTAADAINAIDVDFEQIFYQNKLGRIKGIGKSTLAIVEQIMRGKTPSDFFWSQMRYWTLPSCRAWGLLGQNFYIINTI